MIWKDVPNYIGKYQISEEGEIKSLARKAIKAIIGIDLRSNVYRTLPEKIIKPQKVRKKTIVYLHKDGEAKRHDIHKLYKSIFEKELIT